MIRFYDSRVCERQRDADRHNDRGEDDDEDENPLGKWPHALSSTLACLGCTLGLFNISRFAILSVQFGGEANTCAPLKCVVNTLLTLKCSTRIPPREMMDEGET